MAELREDDLKMVESFLALARLIDKLEKCQDIYDLIRIKNKNVSYTEIEVKIKEFAQSIARKSGKYEELKRIVFKFEQASKRILSKHKDEYDEYLKRKKTKKLKEHFLFQTKRDKILDSKEKSELIEEGKEGGLHESDICSLIEEWKKEYNVREAEHSSSGPIPFGEFFKKTHYEILGVSEDADYAQIKKIYDEEHRKYVSASASKKLKARFRYEEVLDAWECLKDPVKRREYDKKLKEPKTPVPTGKPKLKVERKSDADYTFKDIRRGTVLSEKIVIKNTEGGLLQGKIESDALWLEPDRKKLLEKHEQELYIRIHTSKIPPKTYEVEGKITIDTNGGEETITFKILLETYEIIQKRYEEEYVPLSAALGGFLFSFGNAAVLANFAYLITIFCGVYLKAKEVKPTKDKVIGIAQVLAVTVIGGAIVFAIFGWLAKYFPRFISFVIGAYLAGGLFYIAADPIVKNLLRNGFDISKFPPMLIHGTTVGIVLLAFIINSSVSSTSFQLKPKITINKAVIAKKLDSNKKPVGVSSRFSKGKKTLYYYVNYTGAKLNKTVFKTRWYKNGKQIGQFQSKLNYSAGFYYTWFEYNFTPGKYEVKLFADGQELNGTSFKIASLSQPTKPPRTTTTSTQKEVSRKLSTEKMKKPTELRDAVHPSSDSNENGSKSKSIPQPKEWD